MHTRSTINYQLPQFDSSDKPTWLGDVNGAMLAIDSAMHENATNATEAKTAATSALAALNGALERAQAADTKATQAVSTANSASATATEALTTATAASTTANGVAADLAAARLKSVWAAADPTTEQTPTTATLSDMTAAGKVFIMAFRESNSSAKMWTTGVLKGAGTVKAQMLDVDLSTGAIVQYYREISIAQNDADVTLTIGACNKISTDGSTASATVDNTELVLVEIFASDLPQ